MLASTEPPPPGPKKKTANSPGPPGPGMAAWAIRMLDDGSCFSQAFGRSISIEPAGAPAAAGAWATASPWEEMGAGTAESPPPGWLVAASCGVVAAGVAAAESGAGAFLLQAQTRASSSERVRIWRSMSGLRRRWAAAGRHGGKRITVAPTLTSATISPGERSGAGAFRGLQNRCPAPVAVSGVGSIPMRFRQSGQEFVSGMPIPFEDQIVADFKKYIDEMQPRLPRLPEWDCFGCPLSVYKPCSGLCRPW